VASKWHEFVVEQNDDGSIHVNRLNYEVCVLQALREKVRVREIWVEGANRYRNPNDDLPTDFIQKRDVYYEALHQPIEAEQFIERVKEDMSKALHILDVAIPYQYQGQAPAEPQEGHLSIATGFSTRTSESGKP
jgi:hypothetical protein